MHTHPHINIKRYRRIRIAVIVWLTAVLFAAFLFDIPKIKILEHTARNLYFHVPMWFTMMGAVGLSAWHSLSVLRTGSVIADIRAAQAARVGAWFGALGLATGVVWARFTWYAGTDVWWNFDPRQTMAALQLLIYGAYFVLRSALDDPDKKARLSAVYNLLAFTTVPFLLYILPRQMASLHPGANGNPAFSEITAPIMRYIFYPSIIGFIGLFWILYTQRVRMSWLAHRIYDKNHL